MRLKTCEKCNGYGTYLYDSGNPLDGLKPMACNVCGGCGQVQRDEMSHLMASNYLRDFPKARTVP